LIDDPVPIENYRITETSLQPNLASTYHASLGFKEALINMK